MIFLQKTSHTFTVLLVLLISTILPVPHGMRLELCFGSDGHVDLALSGCPDGGSQALSPHHESPHELAAVYKVLHHGDCLHVPVVCGKTHELIGANGKPELHNVAQKNAPAKMPFIFSDSVVWPAYAYLTPNGYHIPSRHSPSPHLASLRAVILMI